MGFWMCRFGAGSCKRTRLWSNSPAIAAFTSAKPLSRKERKKASKNKLAISSVDPKTGKKHFTGVPKALKESGYLSSIWIVAMCIIHGSLHVDGFHWEAISGGLWSSLHEDSA